MSAFDLRVTLEEVLRATHGTLVRGGTAPVLAGVSTDSRRIPAGGLFIGLPGERFDGSEYGAQALLAGAAAVVVSREKAELAVRGSPSGAVISVDAPLLALGLLARWHRRRMPARVIAITGSNGKTTTKEMLAAALSGAGPTLATEGNLNNEIGAPLTLLGLREEHRFAAIEIGMNHEGEIGRLTAMVEPHVGVVTCAAEVHVEALGSLEGVSRAKGELYHGLALDAVAVANLDDAPMRERARWAGRKTLWFGHAEQADVRIVKTISHDARGLRLLVRAFGRERELTLPVVGLHNAMNACAAYAAAHAVGVGFEAIEQGLATARPPGRRLRLTNIPSSGATLLDDCYNANPASTIAALRTLSELAPEAHRIAVLGDMRELGNTEEQGHREVGKAAAAAKLKLLVAFGPASRHLADAARDAGLPGDRILHTEDPAAAAARVRASLGTHDLVLVKASRGTRLERVSDLLAPPTDVPAETH
jgi:UDP-N-acetylmuramoyl-tripeptide--D-alanyl-D-alanine ligase